jgi:hypothetical protein
MESDGVIHIGRIDFRNDNRVFGIKHEDRFSHLYIIGKTGTGKSTLLETMALQDLQRGNGFALSIRTAILSRALRNEFPRRNGKGGLLLECDGPCAACTRVTACV